MAQFAQYRRTLQRQLKTTDSRWEYIIKDLPDEVDCDRNGYVKSCRLNAGAKQQNIILTLVKIPPNRALSLRPLHEFVHVTCADFRLQTEDGKSATFRESSEYIATFLKTGIVLNGTTYHFYGHSQSQLKSRSCIMMKGSQKEVDDQVDLLGDFSKMKSVAKKAKRIALLFSTAHTVISVDPKRCKDIADIERDDYIFTDGCGNISPRLIKLLAQKKPILFRNNRYHPSVLQIRYRGYKGVVINEPNMDAATWLEFRQSMKKFTGGDDHSFAVVEFSKPAFRFLSSLGSCELAEKVLLEGVESVQGQVRKLVMQERNKMLNKRGENKCRILIPKSRLLFGVCDPRGVLRDGECYVNPTSDVDGVPHAIIGTNVLVARNPCLHPGDLQKLRAVAKSELSHLTDCIVFSTQGRRPAADMMSGGDLDGDTFFVSWDPEIIPSELSQPAEYPGGKEPVQFTAITSDDRIDYFSRSSSMQLGQIKNLFMRWARLKGPLSSECQELNRLFSQCVDANRIKIPERLNNIPQQRSGHRFILDDLHELAGSHIKPSRGILMSETISEDVLLDILSSPTALSQFELAQMTLRWCQKNNASFEEFWHFIDPTSLSTEERAWLMSLLPPRPVVPEIVNNDMMHSDLLLQAELKILGLRNSNIRWRCVYSSLTDRLANLLDVVNKTFPFFTRKLLVLQIHDRLSIAIYLPKSIEPRDEFPLKDCGRLFAFAHDKHAMASSRVIVPTKHNACLYYDHNAFQLYEGQRRNTFVFLTRAVNDDNTYRSQEGRGRQARAREKTIANGTNQEWRTSVALNRFSQGLAKHIGRVHREGLGSAELYVISNRDTRSLRNLDLWLEQIDTDKVRQNFDEDDDIPKASTDSATLDWSREASLVVRVARDQDYDAVQGSSSVDDIQRVLQLAWELNSLDMAAKIYSRYCSLLKPDTEPIFSPDTLRSIFDHLSLRPELVIYFVRMRPWDSLHSSVQNHLLAAIPIFIKALIACANKMGRLAGVHVSSILAEALQVSIQDLRSFTEAIALTVASVETALDLLMEGLQANTSRLVLDTPAKSQYVMKQFASIAIDYIEEASDSKQGSRSDLYNWHFKYPLQEGNDLLLKCDYRIDAPKSTKVAVGDHVRFVSQTTLDNVPSAEHAYFEALVHKVDTGEVTFACLRHPPAFYQQVLWSLENRGKFATTQTTLDAVARLMVQKSACCEVFPILFSSRSNHLTRIVNHRTVTDLGRLNDTQRNAVGEALGGPLTCIWGPPGTGKTHTIVSIIHEVLLNDKQQRLLVTAPTHKAVDNVMRQYLKFAASDGELKLIGAIRVSTEVRKVSSDLRSYTCDAMLGREVNESFAARRKAQKQITNARLVFSTCIGAGLGLLRDEHFANVIIDEASQQTEPASLVPLVKGCSRAILVGDHVQLRATVHPNAQALNFDISLFERLWTEPTPKGQGSSVRRVMLDTQYRMHPALCALPSKQFYEGRLKAALHCSNIRIPLSQFPWPHDGSRAVFVQISTAEDLGRKSKSNSGQAKLCGEVVRRLRGPPQAESTSISPPLNQGKSAQLSPAYTIAILTPYTRQADVLTKLLPNETISSIDGFQGQEADVIIYVTVRCNAHCEIGFLRDMRRLNVAITRAKAGLIVIGDEGTLTGRTRGLGSKDDENGREECFEIWKNLISSCARVRLDENVDASM